MLEDEYLRSGGEIRSMLRVLFNSDFFKNALFVKVKSPAEVVVGTLKLVGGFEFPAPGIGEMSRQPNYMGQDLLNPPSVEGWHTGTEWVNSGSLMRRINFTADMVGDTSRPGVQSMIKRLQAQSSQTPEAFVDGCLELMGPLEVNQETRQELVDHAKISGDLNWASDPAGSSERVGELLQLIVSIRDYHYA